jgi:hypothetical protein
MAFIYRLKHPDGIPADPPTFRSSPGTSWNAGDLLYIGRRTLRVVDTRPVAGPGETPILVVEPEQA